MKVEQLDVDGLLARLNTLHDDATSDDGSVIELLKDDEGGEDDRCGLDGDPCCQSHRDAVQHALDNLDTPVLRKDQIAWVNGVGFTHHFLANLVRHADCGAIVQLDSEPGNFSVGAKVIGFGGKATEEAVARRSLQRSKERQVLWSLVRRLAAERATLRTEVDVERKRVEEAERARDVAQTAAKEALARGEEMLARQRAEAEAKSTAELIADGALSPGIT